MIPIHFPEVTQVLQAPPGLDCGDLPIASVKDPSGNPIIVSCWRLTDAEVRRLGAERRLWLGVVGGGMPPVWMVAHSPFEAEPLPPTPPLLPRKADSWQTADHQGDVEVVDAEDYEELWNWCQENIR